MPPVVLNGPQYLAEGLKLMLRPGLRLFVLLPLLMSIVYSFFRWDGIGNLFVESVGARDYPTVMALTVLTAAFTLAVSVVVEILYRVVDPRLETGEMS